MDVIDDSLSESAKREGDRWTVAGAEWTELTAPLVAPVWGAILTLARVTRGTRVLDVGCGSGEALSLARYRGADVAGIDPADGLIDIARDQLPNADIRPGEMENLPFTESAFNAVLFIISIMYYEDRQSALREADRVLKPDGLIGVSVWGEDNRCDFRHVKTALRGMLPDPLGGEGPYALSSPGALEGLLAETGFEPFDSLELPATFVYANQEHYLQAVLSSGPGQGILEQIDESTAHEALLEAGDPFRRDDGSYRFDNTFKVVTAKAHRPA